MGDHGKMGEIINHFKDRTSLPIDVNEVLEKIKLTGVDVAIEFVGVELDTLIMRGKYRLFHWPVGNMYSQEYDTMANIYYPINSSEAWQRYVCCKEITHLLDDHNHHTSDRDSQVELAKQVGLPPHLRDPFKAPAEANIDVVAELFALALLLPMAARNICSCY
jgi:hypothetical protein